MNKTTGVLKLSTGGVAMSSSAGRILVSIRYTNTMTLIRMVG